MKSITSLVLVVVSVLVFFFFTDKEYKEVQDLQVQIQKNAEVLNTANRLNLKKEELNAKFNQISQSEKVELEKLLPDTVDNVRLIIDINNIANQFGVVIRDISVDTKETEANTSKKVASSNSNFDGVLQEGSVKYVDQSKIGVISFSFSVSAKYEVFLEFLKKLEESLRIVDIRNIEISRASEGVFYDYKVTLDTYWLK